TDPETFFPVGISEAAQEQAVRAKEVCMSCPVRRECLEWALDTEQPHGVLGGLTEEERRELLSLSGRSRSGMPPGVARCEENRERILAWRDQHKSYLWIGMQLGVSRTTVRKAVVQFASEDLEAVA
ncbi:hypothetical protein EF919_39755, partial [Streptomyces sp. WAC02707]|uniref:WhiB family transcriptional regulator n=1 Tax=Streptomyces sp. WAC02707 TaxID=2487417 RepID=UPI000F7A5A14